MIDCWTLFWLLLHLAACPYSGRVEAKAVRNVAKTLVDMGCYEVSLGDTVGKGKPHEVSEMIEEVKKSVPVSQLAVGGRTRQALSAWLSDILTLVRVM